MSTHIEVGRETDGRWLAEIPDLPGVLAYGATAAEAVARVQALSLRVLADRVEHGEPVPAWPFPAPRPVDRDAGGLGWDGRG